jgi:uncharacterized cupredoxin-like copper-binding protein
MRVAPPVVAALLVAAVAGAGCGADTGAVAVVRVVTGRDGDEHEYRFDVPAEVEAGPTRIELDNRGDEPHHAQLVRLDDDATVDDLTAALSTGDPTAVLDVGSFVGGTALVAPGEEARATAVADLSPGTYVLICLVPDDEGVPHVAHGMVEPFEVVADGDEPDAPAPDADVGLVDHSFMVPDSVGPDDLLAVTNRSTTEAHELVVVRPQKGAGIEEVTGALGSGEPLPATAVGGVQAVEPGATQGLQLDLRPGRYVLFCAVPGPDGTPHHQLGMVGEVVVS